MSNLLYVIAVILVIGWIIGLSMHLAGSLIHIALVVAIVLVVINLISGKKSI